MTNLQYLLIGTFAAFGLSLGLTPLIIRLAHRFGHVAQPKKDRWHRTPVALMGGVAIYLAFVIPFLALQAWTVWTGFFLAGCSMMFGVGLIDEIIPIRPYSKLLAQIVASCIVMIGGLMFEVPEFPILAVSLTLLWIVGIVNAMNLLDNMDGLSAGTAAISAFFLTLISLALGNQATALSGAVLLGAALGFLAFNFSPARIFMGDSGSLFLGFALATLSLESTGHQTANLILTLLTPALILAVPIFDTTFITVVRLLNGRAVSQGGRDHTSHRLVAFGLSERRTGLLLYAMSFVCGSVAFLGILYSALIPAIIAALIVVGLFYFGIFLSGAVQYRDIDDLNGHGAVRRWEGPDVFLMYKKRIVELATDMVLVGLSFVIAFLLRFDGTLSPYYLDLIAASLTIILPLKLLVFFYHGLYRGVWRYASIQDMISVLKAVTSSSLLVVLAMVMFFRFEGYPRSVFIIDWVVLLLLVGGVRLLIRVIGEYLGALSQSKGQPVLILGAGDAGELLARELRNNRRLGYVLRGFLDDDPEKVGRRVHGLPVFGGRKVMRDVVLRHDIREIFVAIPSASADDLTTIMQECSKTGAPARIVGPLLALAGHEVQPGGPGGSAAHRLGGNQVSGRPS